MINKITESEINKMVNLLVVKIIIGRRKLPINKFTVSYFKISIWYSKKSCLSSGNNAQNHESCQNCQNHKKSWNHACWDSCNVFPKIATVCMMTKDLVLQNKFITNMKN